MSRRVARPYAVALYEVTRREGIPALREIERQLAAVAGLFAKEPALLRVFEVPSVTPAVKREIVATIARAMALRPETGRMLVALEAHIRLRFLPDVVQMFRELVDRADGVVRARAELPAAPDPAQLAALEKALARLFAARIELDVQVHPELLAGFVVRVGSQVFDGSLAAQLRRFAASAAQ
jgi:F-type H+-transporting ATPase subunit delta